MTLEELPEAVKKDIEDQSLEILEHIKDNIIVIGGWGVRAHLGGGHHRYTLDVDGVTSETKLQEIKKVLETIDLEENPVEWGIQFYKQYVPTVDVPEKSKIVVDELQLRIEISPPRIKEHDTHHYFEYRLTKYDNREIPYHNKDKNVEINVPPIEHMAAVKLGLPVDYKNNHDAAMLLQKSDIDRVIQAIQENDDWYQMVLRRMPKLKGRIRQKGNLANILATAAGLNIKEHIKKLEYIENRLSSQ